MAGLRAAGEAEAGVRAVNSTGRRGAGRTGALVRSGGGERAAEAMKATAEESMRAEHRGTQGRSAGFRAAEQPGHPEQL